METISIQPMRKIFIKCVKCWNMSFKRWLSKDTFYMQMHSTLSVWCRILQQMHFEILTWPEECFSFIVFLASQHQRCCCCCFHSVSFTPKINAHHLIITDKLVTLDGVIFVGVGCQFFNLIYGLPFVEKVSKHVKHKNFQHPFDIKGWGGERGQQPTSTVPKSKHKK